MATEQATNRYFLMVRDFAVRTKAWEPAIRYMTLPDEVYNIMLVSLRVYGTHDEWLTVQAAAGLDSPENELKQGMLVLPTAQQLADMRTRAGFDGYMVI